jgi:RNA polymerase sigma factor (sigma-70 family)
MEEGSSPHTATENQELAGDSSTSHQPAAEMVALVTQHHASVYRYAARLCGCPTEAEDLTQQTFLIAQQKLPQLREAERAGGWLLTIVRNCYLKGRKKMRPVSAESIGLDVQQFAEEMPASEEIDRELLSAALVELPVEFRVVVLMFYFEDLSYQQIAEQLEIPIGTVMSRLSRGKAHLRKRLASADAKSAIAAPHVVPASGVPGIPAAIPSGSALPPGVRAAP